jgi:hypothetical protein
MSGPGTLVDQAEIGGSYLLAAAPENGSALAPPGETSRFHRRAAAGPDAGH